MGAATMKMINSTNMTSIMGVMLISAICPCLLPGVNDIGGSFQPAKSTTTPEGPFEISSEPPDL
jgi:hypothetical protein